MTGLQDSFWVSLPVPAILLDEESRIVEINPAAESFLNASARQAMGMSAFDVLGRDVPIHEHAARVRREA